MAAILPPEAASAAGPVAAVIAGSLSNSSLRSYSSQLTKFISFCTDRDFCFLPASHETVLLYAYHLAEAGTVQASTAQPYFSAINTFHEFFGHPKPAADYAPLQRFRQGWQRLQQPLAPAAPLQLAMRASTALSLALCLSGSLTLQHLRPLLFSVILFATMLRPDSLLSVVNAKLTVANSGTTYLWAYQPTRWKGKLLQPSALPTFQLVLSAPGLAAGLVKYHQLHASAWGSRTPPSLWCLPSDSSSPTTRTAEVWFEAVVARHLPPQPLRHTIYSMRRGSASAAFAIGVRAEKIEYMGGWSINSAAFRRHYLDMSVVADSAARTFFGWLLDNSVPVVTQQFFLS